MAIKLIGGGSRSGKSRHALELATGARRAFVATAQAFDDEMRERISRHQAERSSAFETYEEPLELPALLDRIDGRFDSIVVDCLTLWLSNLMLAERDVPDVAIPRKSSVIFVTNEVGCGIVPENDLARRFRDEQGRLNQRIAAVADQVIWMVFGCPLRVKG